MKKILFPPFNLYTSIMKYKEKKMLNQAKKEANGKSFEIINTDKKKDERKLFAVKFSFIKQHINTTMKANEIKHYNWKHRIMFSFDGVMFSFDGVFE